MGGSAQRTGIARTLRVFLAAICVLLVVFLGTVQAVHVHPDTAYHANCSLCATVHVTVQLTETPAPAPAAHIVARVELLPPALLPSELTAFSHFSRPPPLQTLPA